MWQLIMVGVILVAIFCVVFLNDTIPPNALTHGRMHVMKRRILRFAADHGALPKKIEHLPRMEGMDNGVCDGWARPILWRIEGDKIILTSYGRDGIPGGAGEDSDMIAVFRAKTKTGGWANEFCEWEIDPYGRKGTK